MKKFLPFVATALILCSLPTSAQLFWESFETGVNSWEEPCACSEPMQVADTPGGTGDWSLRVTAENSNDAPCLCAVTWDLGRDLSWLPSGPMTLSYWSKGHGGIGPPASVKVAYSDGTGYPSLTEPWGNGNTSPTWNYSTWTFDWSTTLPNADGLQLLIAAGAAQEGPLFAYFDDIRIDGLTTDIHHTSLQEQPTYRPNPATDKLWVDLAEKPTDVSALDATGRAIEISSFTYRDHTLEVDLAVVAPGLTLLKVTSRAGTRTVRFIKT